MAADDPIERRPLYAFNGGLLAKGRVRRVLELAGWDIRFGKPSEDDAVGVWGASPTSPRGETVANFTGSPIVRVEDAFLRSLHPGRNGEPPIGLLVDDLGVHFDGTCPSRLEHILANHPFDDTALLNRARAAIEFMKAQHLTKYCAVDPNIDLPDPGFVLVIDQTHGDASVTSSGANMTTFKEMLVQAQLDHPDAQIVVKTHPETVEGHRKGYFSESPENGNITFLSDPVSPWSLFENARAVYTVSSGMGFEAILAGHRPVVFGQPFYAGWGLSRDENAPARRERKLTAAQLFAGAMILAPVWYDPFRDRLCQVEDVLTNLAAQARAWREDRSGWVASGMSSHKHARISQMFGSVRPVTFANSPKELENAMDLGKRPMVWSTKSTEAVENTIRRANRPITRVEDGFLRSRGLGAALIPAMSLALDDRGIYYDPIPESRLEDLIQASVDLPQFARDRASNLMQRIRKLGLTKYNHGTPTDDSGWPQGPRVLVVGQVEDDASVTKGCHGGISTNLDLLKAARTGVPNGVLIYKPHPDVQAGYRKGGLALSELEGLADVVLTDENSAEILEKVEAVWTLTSLLGFEALLRGLPVTCVGTPFYAGWGLTRDFGKIPGRRTARPSLESMVHAVLIDYPRYLDPVTLTACPVEVIVDRLAEGGETAGLRGRAFSFWRRLFPSR